MSVFAFLDPTLQPHLVASFPSSDILFIDMICLGSV
jgi:hypothetical protein